MKRIIAVIIAAAVLLGLAAIPASAAVNRLPGEPIAGCQYRSFPPTELNWSEALNFWYTNRYRTSNGTCPRDAVRYFHRHWSENDTVCARVTLRTFNDDGTLRRIWPSVTLCPGQEGGFVNVDNRRLFRLEFRTLSVNQEFWNNPSGSINF